jgi:hypothetical protein
MVETDHLIDKTSTSYSEKEAVALSSDHTSTRDTSIPYRESRIAKVLGEISKQNLAGHSDEGKNDINRFRRSNYTISCKLLSIDGSVGEISETLRWGFLVWRPISTG